MVHGHHGVLGRVVRFLVEVENKQEVELAQTLLQLMEVPYVWEMKMNQRHATPFSVKVYIDLCVTLYLN